MTKKILTGLAGTVVLGLCVVSVIQWKREFQLRSAIGELTNRLRGENAARVEFEEKAARFEKEIARITTLREQTEAALAEASENVLGLSTDLKSRGGTIAAYMNLYFTPGGETESSEGSADVIKERNETVEAQNAAITKANSAIRKLAAERDDAIGKLNDRIRAFNQLTEKYNRLAAKQ